MADQQARDLRTALESFDSLHLHKVMVAAYDRWCWESGTDSDKEWYETAEAILKERGVEFTTNANQGKLSIHADSVTLQSAQNGMEQELFSATGGGIDIGFDLRCALIRFLGDEMAFGSMTTNQGKRLREIIKEAAREAIRETV